MFVKKKEQANCTLNLEPEDRTTYHYTLGETNPHLELDKPYVTVLFPLNS